MNALATIAWSQQDATAARASTESLYASFLLGVVLLAASLAALPFALRVVRIIAPAEAPLRPTWGLRQVALLVLVFIVLSYVAGAYFMPADADFLTLLSVTSAVNGALVALALLIASAGGRDGLRAFGIRNTGNARAVIGGAAMYVVAIPGILGVGALWNLVLTLSGRVVEPQAILTGFEDLDPTRRLVPLLIGVMLIPLFEEALFRGLLQPVLVHFLRPVAGIAITSILFGALHGLDAFLPIFALSVLLGWIRHRTQRLSAAWAIHALHNGGQFVLLYMFPEVLERVEKTGLLVHHS